MSHNEIHISNNPVINVNTAQNINFEDRYFFLKVVICVLIGVGAAFNLWKLYIVVGMFCVIGFGLYGFYRILFRGQTRDRRDALRYRADKQDNWYAEGDPRGVYGE